MNEKRKKALETGKYICPECGKLMVFEDEQWRDSLVCENCGYSCKLDDYGDDPDDVDRRRIAEIAGSPDTETYEEVYNEDDD